MVAPNPNPLLAAFAKPAQNKQANNPFTAAFQNSAQTNAPAQAETPFMAQSLDKYGLPYYGEGFRGFARKVFAKIFDPSKLLPKPTEAQAKLIEQAGETGDEMLEKKGWDQWVKSWTGIDSEEVSQAAAAMKLAISGSTEDEQGNIQVNEGVDFGKGVATTAGVLYRGAGQVISAGLEALSLADKGVRKVQAFNVALDDVGDASTVLPDITRNDEALVKLFGDTPTTQRLGNLLNAGSDLVPLTFAYNLIRAATSGQSLYQKTQTVKDNLRASNMIYTMYWDEAKKAEYFRRAKAGENPDLLMRELENPWVELAGSVLGDPTTYMGMGIIGKVGKASTPVKMFGKTIFKLPWETVARIPGFTEILGLRNIGKARLAASADVTRMGNAKLEQLLSKLGDAKDEPEAVKALQAVVEQARKDVREWGGFFDDAVTNTQKADKLKATYGIFAPDSTAKAELHKKTVGNFMQLLSSRFRNTDDILETFKAYKNLSSKDNATATRAFMHLKEVYGGLAFSDMGKQSMEFMSRLIDDVNVDTLVTKYGNDLPKMVESLTAKVDGIVDDMYPAVNDMEKAFNEVKQLGKAASPRQTMLAKAYKDIQQTRPSVIWMNRINRGLSENKLYSGMQSFYAGVLMGMRPAYALRNLMSNTVVIWHDLGTRAAVEAFATGLETFAKSAAGRALKQDWAANVVARESDKVKNILGFLPSQMLKGVGSAGREGFGFLAVGQDVEKVHSAIITRYVVEAEMDKLLKNGGIPDVAAIGLPREMADMLLSLHTKNFGDVAKTMQEFRAAQATGFFETWRHAELNPALKDTLRRANLLDELEDIRKLSPDPVAFSDAMDAFIGKIDDLAKRTADEPALVSDANPLADAVATVEKAFDEGGRKVMSEEELNQFRALVELRSQLRNQYQDYVDIMRDRIGRLLPPEQVRPFEEQFSKLRNILEDGNSKWRGYADELYRGVYARSRKGESPASLWNQVRTVMLDVQDGKPVLKKISLADAYPNVDPTTITNSEFDGMMWKWFKEQQGSFWRGYTQDFVAGQDAILKQMAQAAGVTVEQIKLAEYGNLANPRLKQITDLTNQIGEWERYLDYDSFARAEPAASDLNRLMETTDEAARAASNVNAPPPVDQSISIASDVEGNPLKLLQEKGGITADEFSDIMGGKRGVDRQGVVPGLFTKGGMGLDDAGRVLSDAGYITPEQAEDLNFVREFIRKPTGKTQTFTQEGARLSDMDLSGVPNWKGGKSHLFNAVNADRAKRGQSAYSTIDEVPFEEAVQVLQKRTKPIPPYVEGAQPTVTRQLYENLNGGFRAALEDFKNGTLTKWGQKVPLETNLTDEMESALSTWVKEADKRTLSNRAAVSTIADETRNFILHDYNKTYADKFASYFLMYHYWGSRTYARWMERALDTPGTLATYSKWRSTMEKVHSDQPEFYRYNAQIPAKALLGLNDSPIFFNLEAALNPLYGLTGVDFNDPKKRVDWLSSAVDDMGKMGFNANIMLQWAMAYKLYTKGEDEAARRWLGRMIPATQDLKAGLNLLKDKTGVDLMPDMSILPGAKYGEFDPFINLQGGFDAYEEKRIGRALAAMVDNGEITEEESFEIMRAREGSAWDEAVTRAINERAPGQMASYFLGVGFKTRTEGDLKVEEFYNKYYKLLSMRESMSPEQYRQAFDQLRSDPNYRFADTVLLSARGGDERDSVYAYNVLGRLPPGDQTEILRGMGISDDLVSKFYESKGDFSEWTPQDKDRFMSAMLDLGATFAMPDQSTRQEWNEAKDLYKEVQKQISDELGLPYEGNQRGVWDVISTYYDLKDSNADAAEEFKRGHPEIEQAFSMMTEAKLSDPSLAKYYASLDLIESYYFGKTRAYLAEKYGADITEKQTMYFNLKVSSAAEAKAFLRQHPELKAYWNEKKGMDGQANTFILQMANSLPEAAEGAQLREDFEPANATQEMLTQYAGAQTATWEQVSAPMSLQLQDKVMQYAQMGVPLSRAANAELSYLAKKYGYYDADDMLRQAVFSLMQGQAQPQPAGNPLLDAMQGQVP